MTPPTWFLDVIAATLSVPIEKALVTMLAYGLVSILILWKTTHRNPVVLSAKLIAGFTVIRISGSYWDYNHGFVEGLWPIVWTAFGLLVAFWGYNAGRKSAPHDNACP